MRHFYQFTLIIAFLFGSVQAFSVALMEADSVTMGSGYANDIYYSFENGEVSSVERGNWDIGFYTSAWSAGIIINDGAGIELCVYENGDTTNWNSIDTTGLSNWPVLYNSGDDWEEGAFNRNSLGHPDYGWGVYNVVHDVVGDSIYIVKYSNDNMKKLWIEKKVSVENTYYFKYADLDGENEISVELLCNDYLDKNFVYYSMLSEAILDREPGSDTWDILFTKYNTILEEGSPYIVTGVLNNIDVSGNRFDMVGHDYTEWYSLPMDTTRASVDWDWKSFDFATGWLVQDSTVFFVTDINGNVNKLRFLGFEGMSSGKIIFEKSLTSLASVSTINKNAEFILYPNPASDKVQVSLEGEGWEELIIADLSGREVVRMPLGNQPTVTVPLGQLNSGVYLVTLQSGVSKAIQKLVIQ